MSDTATDPTFRLRTVAEITAYLEDMVKGGGFAAFRVGADVHGVVRSVEIRMRMQDEDNEMRRKITSAVLHATFTSHGSPDVEIVVCRGPWA